MQEIFGRSTKSVENDRIKKEQKDAALEAKRNRNKSIVCETGTFQESAKHVVQTESVADYFKRKMAEKLKPKAIGTAIFRVNLIRKLQLRFLESNFCNGSKSCHG